MENAVILGAGRLGKGFLGETLANAPRWHTTFLDKDAGVIRKLKETGSYHVQVYRKECMPSYMPISCFLASIPKIFLRLSHM